MSLSDVIADPARKEEVIDDGMSELKAEVDALSGLKGKAVGGAFNAVQKMRPGFIEDNVERMLPMFAPAIDPHYEAGKAAGDVPAHFVANGDAIAEDMLAVTDQRAADASNKVAVGIYEKLRKSAKGYVVAAMPRLGPFVDRHATS